MRPVAVLAVLLALSTVLAGAALAGDASLAGLDEPADRSGAQADVAATDAMGSEISSFVHAQQGAAEGEVEQGMWNASFNRQPSADAVEQRSDAMARQLKRLRERREALQTAYENGEIPEGKYRAKMAKIEARLAALQSAANDTASAAKRVGASPEQARQVGKRAAKERGKIPAGVGPGGTPPGHGGAPPGQQGDGAGQQGNGPGNSGNNGRGQSMNGPPGLDRGQPPGQADDTETETETETESGDE